MKTKRLIDTAFVYAIAALVCGIFEREFTKAFAFTGRTILAFTHVHLFALGTLLFLLLALFNVTMNVGSQPIFQHFYRLYNVALPFMVILFMVRGIFQVLGTPLSAGADAAISGIAGLFHMLMGIAVVLLFLALRKAADCLNS